MVSQKSTIDLLPFDIKQLILDEIESEEALLQLALSSKGWCGLVIPNHLEYRSLRLDVDRPALWSHLAQKAGLASRIRTVVLGPNYPNVAIEGVEPWPFQPDICPRAPIEERIEAAEEPRRSCPKDVEQAFANMARLETFQWLVRTQPWDPATGTQGGIPELPPIHDEANAWSIFSGLQQSGSVKELYITDHDWRLFYRDSQDLQKPNYPVSLETLTPSALLKPSHTVLPPVWTAEDFSRRMAVR